MNPYLVAGLQSDKHVKNSSGKVFKTRVRVPLPPQISDSWKDNGFECTLNTRSLMHTCTLSKTVVFGDLCVNKKREICTSLIVQTFYWYFRQKSSKVYQINTS